MTAATMLQTDQDLVSAALRGETRAFGDLVARYRGGVVGVVYRMCGDMGLAEEAAQDAFLRAWQHLSGYRPEFAFRTWIYRIAINAALDALRRDRRLIGVDDLPEDYLVETRKSPESTVEERERSQRIRRAVLNLPPGSRSVLVLREYGSMSYSEISAALSIPLGTVMSRLNSARGQLRQELVGVLEVL